MNMETRQALSLLHKSVQATTQHAENVDMRSLKAADRDVVRQARVQLYALDRDLAKVLTPTQEDE